MSRRLLVLAGACALGITSAASAQVRPAQTFDSNGVPISYVDNRGGVPVVLLHGFTGSYARHWEGPGVLTALEAAGYRAIAMDLRGHGQSGRPRDPGQYGMKMVGDVIGLLDHLQITRAHIVGYSMGGAIAAQLAVKYPERVLTLTLLGSGWEGDTGEPITSELTTMAADFERRDASSLFRSVAGSGLTDAEVAAATADLFARNPPEVLAAVLRTAPPLWRVSHAQLGALTMPVLAIVGELDTRNLEPVKRMEGVVPGLRVVRLPGATHASSVRPSAVHIVAFLNEHRNH